MVEIGPGHLVSRVMAEGNRLFGKSTSELLWSKFAPTRARMLAAGNFNSSDEVAALLSIRDLSDPNQGEHAMQLLLADVTAAVGNLLGGPVTTHRSEALVHPADNYDNLCFTPSAIARDRRYSNHISDTQMFRTHLSALAPRLLARMRTEAHAGTVTYALPGLAYRRDTIDRYHVATPHQVDYWHAKQGVPFTTRELRALAAAVVHAVLPGAQWRLIRAKHPYTRTGFQIDVRFDGAWLELAECGIINQACLDRNGLAMDNMQVMSLGLGLDRALMCRKGIPDIRYLRASEPAIADQLQDLHPWRAVTDASAVTRQLAVLVPHHEDEDTLGDGVRWALGEKVAYLERLHVRDTRKRIHTVPGTGRQLAHIELELTLRALDGQLPPDLIDEICQTIDAHMTGLRLMHTGDIENLVE